MAISPNTNFTSGQILTATNANQWPRGIVAYAQDTANTAIFTTAITTLTASAFTAVAGRYYRVTYFDPILAYVSGTVNFIAGQIKNGATVLQIGTAQISGQRSSMMVQYVGTFSAGSVTLTSTIETSGGGSAIGSRSATGPAFILVEDLGLS